MTRTSDDLRQRQRALSRWDNEGGAIPSGSQASLVSSEDEPPLPDMANAELEQLHIRMIALENLVIALLATASDRQLELAQAMISYISPRPGATHHPLTIHAAVNMANVLERAGRFRSGELP